MNMQLHEVLLCITKITDGSEDKVSSLPLVNYKAATLLKRILQELVMGIKRK